MSTAGFRQLRHTADIYLEAYGQTLEQAFEQAGLALFRTLIPEAEGAEKTVRVEASGADLHELLYDWLEKLLHVFELSQLVGTEVRVFKISRNSVYTLEGEVVGVQYSREKHRTGTAVKSPTYALMEVDTEKNIVRFVLDI
ncbi:MAG: archease [Candidatus Caldarchaeum sp.]|nr:archease [Candidatus Caldarchaeum sp.]MCS7137121.1 archease [Candidatus Caldarchaeum sp.]MDW7977435.1 archease [Candidatus Caldarchaeum sp.]MDW8359753.1 archease [Candidatus Caldarchaeum sp.]